MRGVITYVLWKIGKPITEFAVVLKHFEKSCYRTWILRNLEIESCTILHIMIQIFLSELQFD